MIRQFAEWLEQRTGLRTAVRKLLDEEIPASSGWHQVFGSVALFLFLTQAFTGILLAFNYAATPGDAYDSLKYIMSDVAGGRMIRGLHRWGASMMIAVVTLHMIQVFLYGAYKKPREVTWMAGVVLLLITLTFGLTGYLLPGDNRAYWGTVVTTQIAGHAPVLGGYLRRLMGVENGVGAVTFARFYALHTMLLPACAFLLIGLHVSLVLRHGIAPAAVESKPKRRFYPQQAFLDVTAIFVAFAILFVLAAVVQVPLEQLADPNDASYTPRPDWYFLFLFQMLRFFKGASEVFGSILLPTVAIGTLFAVPFIDRARLKRVTERTVAFGVVILSVAGWASLTAAAVVTTPKSAGNQAATQGWAQLAPEELVGFGYFRQERCSNCHNLVDGEPKVGPNLAELATVKSTEEMIAHLKNPEAGSKMAIVEANTPQLEALSAFLRRLTPENAKTFSAVPPQIVAGARVFVVSSCGACHRVNGTGGAVGPPLNGVAVRHTREWVAQHLRDPKSHSPATSMPRFAFAPNDRDLLISYLFSLPGS
jgi:ubiquinol-cytochrome c reductase cytochrome b subunit